MLQTLFLTLTVLAMHIGFTACAPIPIETHPHPVEVKSTDESTGKHLEAARVSAIEDETFLQRIVAEIRVRKKTASIVSAKEFMDTIFPSQRSATVKELTSESAIQRIRDLSVTHIIVIGYRTAGSNTRGDVAVVASLINVEQTSNMETLSFEAEGERVGFSLPLPYIFLVFPYSDPDVLGSAATKVAHVLSKKILENPNSPLRLTILLSDNLVDLVPSTHPRQNPAVRSPHSEDMVDRWKNPLGLYSDLMSDARDEGDWIYYNPLGHLSVLLSSIIMAPTMVITDAIIGEYERTPMASEPVYWMSDEQQFGYAMDAIERSDWEAGYRLLEDFVASDNEMLRLKTLQLFDEHPELLQAAQHSFSVESLDESKRKYGAQSTAIEEKRLGLFRMIANPEMYAEAQKNFLRVFGQGGTSQ